MPPAVSARDQAPGRDELLALGEAHGIEMTRSIENALTETGEEETNSVAASSAAYLTIAWFSGDAAELLTEYRKHSDVMSEVGRDHGLIVHAGAKTDGGLMIVNLWPSKEASEAAARDPRRRGVIERAGVSPDQIRREHYELAHFAVFD